MQHLCTALVIMSLGIGTAAHAQCTSAETTPAPADTTPTTEPPTSTLPLPGWSTDVRIGIPATFSDTGVVFGIANFELGIGDRVDDRWYLGATAEWMLGTNIGTDSSPVTSSLRAGAEARYIFHQGVASVSTNDGPFYDTPRYDWIGLRGGVQSVSGAHGGFGELALGLDAKANDAFAFGMYLAVGVNLEPPDAYGMPAMSDDESGIARVVTTPPSYVLSPYVTIGWSFMFG